METSPYITLSQAILALKSGNVIGIPTETVYGLAADILQEHAVSQIFTLKNRPIDHPLIVHIADPADLDVYATQVPDYAKALAMACWPGPLTLVLRKSSRIGPWITGGQETVGIRLPRHSLTQALIRELGVPLAAPSANQFGKISPTTAAHVLEEFAGRVPVLDGGACDIGIESTIVLATDPHHCTVLRPGMIERTAIQAIVGSRVSVDTQTAPSQKMRVSGNLDSHYAPSKPVVLCQSYEEWRRIQAAYPHRVYTIYYSADYTKGLTPASLERQLSSDPHRYAQELYASLRTADHSAAQIIAIEAPASDIGWAAIGDRLKKSSARGLLLDVLGNTR